MEENVWPEMSLSSCERRIKKRCQNKNNVVHKERFVFSGKDARLYVFRLRALRRGMEEKQLVRSKCDSRENKLEKTKGEVLGIAEFTKKIPTDKKG